MHAGRRGLEREQEQHEAPRVGCVEGGAGLGLASEEHRRRLDLVARDARRARAGRLGPLGLPVREIEAVDREAAGPGRALQHVDELVEGPRTVGVDVVRHGRDHDLELQALGRNPVHHGVQECCRPVLVDFPVHELLALTPEHRVLFQGGCAHRADDSLQQLRGPRILLLDLVGRALHGRRHSRIARLRDRPPMRGEQGRLSLALPRSARETQVVGHQLEGGTHPADPDGLGRGLGRVVDAGGPRRRRGSRLLLAGATAHDYRPGGRAQEARDEKRDVRAGFPLLHGDS